MKNELAGKLMQREYRNGPMLTVRSGSEENWIAEGYAATFGQPYVLFESSECRILEEIAPTAFDGCDMSDVIVQYDHTGRVFARTKNGTLTLAVDGHGLMCRMDLGGTEAGRQLHGEIKGGYTTKMSFGFTVAEDERTEVTDRETGRVTVTRRITKIKKLYDVSAVSLPANDATEISARSLCDGWIAELTEECRKAGQRKSKTNKLKLYLEVHK